MKTISLLQRMFNFESPTVHCVPKKHPRHFWL